MSLELLLPFLSNASPALLYLAGLVFLFFRLEKVQQRNTDSLTALIERYHAMVGEQVHTLAIISERLDK